MIFPYPYRQRFVASQVKRSIGLNFNCIGILCLYGLLLGCDHMQVEDPSDVIDFEDLILSDSLILNPTGYVPLAAQLDLETTTPVQIEIEIVHPHRFDASLIHRFEPLTTSFSLPILGLFPAHNNTIRIRFYSPRNQLIGEITRSLETEALLPELPEITVRINTERKKTGMNLVSYFGHTNFELPDIPFIFDQHGYIRWYANMDAHPALKNLSYSSGLGRLRNGNLYMADVASARIVEMDMLGNILHQWLFPGYDFHHDLMELPNGNLLATVTKKDHPTIQDHVVEIHRTNGNLVQIWDLQKSLDSSRLLSLVGNPTNWLHANGLSYDEEDDAIIVSSRIQGTIKLTRNNEVVWILAPHRGWNQSGDGANLSSKLLQPLDANGTPISDPQVLEGFVDHPDFSWPWHQHAPQWIPPGKLFLFDNGYLRNYQVYHPTFSRAVEYQINEDAMTIQQIWEYGRDRNIEAYSEIVSDVDYHEAEQSVIFMPGANSRFGLNGKTIEIDYKIKSVLYEAEIRKLPPAHRVTFQGIERIPLYASDHNDSEL